MVISMLCGLFSMNDTVFLSKEYRLDANTNQISEEADIENDIGGVVQCL